MVKRLFTLFFFLSCSPVLEFAPQENILHPQSQSQIQAPPFQGKTNSHEEPSSLEDIAGVMTGSHARNGLGKDAIIFVDYKNFDSLSIPVESIINQAFFDEVVSNELEQNKDIKDINFYIDFEIDPKDEEEVVAPSLYKVENADKIVGHSLPLTLKNAKSQGSFAASGTAGNPIINQDSLENNRKVIDGLPVFYFANGPIEIEVRLTNDLTQHVFTNVITLVEQYRLPYILEKYPILNVHRTIAGGGNALTEGHIKAVSDAVLVIKQMFHFPAFKKIINEHYNIDPARKNLSLTVYESRIYNTTKNIEFRRVTTGAAGYTGIGSSYIAVATWRWEERFNTAFLNTVLHEYGHTVGYAHSENVTYGLSDFLTSQFYSFMKNKIGNGYTGFDGTQYWYDENDPKIRKLNDALKQRILDRTQGVYTEGNDENARNDAEGDVSENTSKATSKAIKSITLGNYTEAFTVYEIFGRTFKDNPLYNGSISFVTNNLVVRDGNNNITTAYNNNLGVLFDGNYGNPFLNIYTGFNKPTYTVTYTFDAPMVLKDVRYFNIGFNAYLGRRAKGTTLTLNFSDDTSLTSPPSRETKGVNFYYDPVENSIFQ